MDLHNAGDRYLVCRDLCTHCIQQSRERPQGTLMRGESEANNRERVTVNSTADGWWSSLHLQRHHTECERKRSIREGSEAPGIQLGPRPELTP